MSDPTGGTVANITLAMLKRVAMAARTSPQAVATAVETIAAELGTSSAAVVRGIAVLTERVSTSAATAGWAGTATTAVEGAMAEGALVTSEVVVAGTTAATTGGAVTAAVTWFGGLTIGAKVALVAAVIGGTVLVARGAGWAASDAPSAVSGAGPGTSAEFGATIPEFNEGYQAVGVYFDGKLSIVSVRGTEDIADGIPPCRFRHGGINCDADADVRPLAAGEVFPDAKKATNALCGLLGGGYYAPALAAGWVAPYGGGTVTLDDWGAVDFAECDKVIGG